MKIIHIFFFVFVSQLLLAQVNDCAGAQVVCSSESIDFNPGGPGIQDISGIELGCLDTGENSSVWFFFAIASDAPNDLSLEFLIIPENGIGQDYDFALYGPDVFCDNLGAPIRCSYAFLSPSTGLASTSFDFSEGADGDGYVAPINVNPNEGYFLLIDNFGNDGVGFELQWSGPAAPFLNCDITPPCALSIELESIDQCRGEGELDYTIDIGEDTDDLSFSWTSPTGNLDWLDDPTVLNPEINVPDDFVGSATFEIEVNFLSFDCSDSQMINVNIFDYPTLEGMNDISLICTNDLATIGSTAVNDPDTDFSWELDGQFVSNNELLEADNPGKYVLTADLNGCVTIDSLIIEKIGDPIELFELSDSTNFCVGPEEGIIHISNLEGGNAPYIYTLNTGVISDDLFFEGLPGGIYEVLVTDVDGCTSIASIEIDDYELYTIEALQDTTIDLGEEIDVIAESTIPDDIIIFEEWTPLDLLINQNRNVASVLPLEDIQLTYTVIDENNCEYETSIWIRVDFEENVYIANAFSPNDDGLNDVLYIQSGLAVRSINSFIIYNRWGERVYEAVDLAPNDLTVGWDGTFKGRPVANSGTYAYRAEIEFINGVILEKTGTITIVN